MSMRMQRDIENLKKEVEALKREVEELKTRKPGRPRKEAA